MITFQPKLLSYFFYLLWILVVGAYMPRLLILSCYFFVSYFFFYLLLLFFKCRNQFTVIINMMSFLCIIPFVFFLDGLPIGTPYPADNHTGEEYGYKNDKGHHDFTRSCLWACSVFVAVHRSVVPVPVAKAPVHAWSLRWFSRRYSPLLACGFPKPGRPL